eukprot:XP_003632313.1 PREDICTED: non-specific lipid-transfer protein-like protein At2g13820 isoform X1 [Vitis vinifera]
MGTRGNQMGLALVLLTLLWHGAMAQSGCTRVLIGLAPCLNYISGNSSTPSSSCCSQLANVVQSQPQCLCAALNSGGAGLGITINQTLALQLPGACNVKTPSVSQCNAANGPTASAISPESSPADSSDETPDVTPTTQSLPSIPSGTGSKSVPATDGSTSDGTIMELPLTLTILALFIASHASTFTGF